MLQTACAPAAIPCAHWVQAGLDAAPVLRARAWPPGAARPSPCRRTRPLERALRHLDALLPSPLREAEGRRELFAARALVVGSLATVLVSLVTLAARLAQGEAPPAFLLTNGLAVAVAVGIVVALRRRGSVALPGALGLTCLGCLLVFRAIQDGGLDSMAIAWLPLLSMLSILVLGRRAGLVVGLASVLSVVLIVRPGLVGLAATLRSASPANRILSLAILILLQLTIVYLWDRERTHQEDRLAASNASLRETVSQLERRSADAEALAEARSRLVAVVSHELYTPLNGIVGLSESLLDRGAAAEDAPEVLANLHQSALLMEGLIGDMLELSRLEREPIAPVLRPVGLDDLAHELVALFGPLAAQRGLGMHLRCPAGLAPVLSDRDRLAQVLRNLLLNAIKFTERGAVTLAVDLAPAGPGRATLSLAVSDTGRGIAAADHARVFARFEQGDADIRRRHGGTGLGLAVVREVVTALGGQVALDSAPGAGATFTVTLPVALAAAPAPAAPRSGARLLVVDDNPINLRVAALLLEDMGHQVVAVTGGHEALAIVDDLRPDMILMDCMMPGLTGGETAIALRERGVGVPIVAVTADVSDDSRARALAAGMDDHITKPLRRELLERTLARHLPVPASARA